MDFDLYSAFVPERFMKQVRVKHSSEILDRNLWKTFFEGESSTPLPRFGPDLVVWAKIFLNRKAKRWVQAYRKFVHEINETRENWFGNVSFFRFFRIRGAYGERWDKQLCIPRNLTILQYVLNLTGNVFQPTRRESDKLATPKGKNARKIFEENESL